MTDRSRAAGLLIVLVASILLLACSVSLFDSPKTATPVVIVVTATPAPATQTPVVIVVTATPASTTATPVAPTPSPMSTSAPTAAPVGSTGTPTPTASSVGSAGTPAPTAPVIETADAFGPIIFAAGVFGTAPNYKPVDVATRFPEGVTQVRSLFSNTTPLKGNQWRFERYLDGKLQPELASGGYDLTDPGTTWANVWKSDGVTPGDWEVRLYVMDKLVQKGTFTIERNKPGAAYIGPIRFAEDIKDDKPVNIHRPIDSFKAGTKKVYVFFDAGNMVKGSTWKREWYHDGQLLPNLVKSETWSSSQSVKDLGIAISNDPSLEPGTWEVKFYIDDRLVQLGVFTIEK